MTTHSYSDGAMHRFLLSPLGLTGENAGAWWILILSAAVSFWGLLYFQGNIPAVLGLLYMIGIIILTILRIDYSLYLLVWCVMIFDQYAIPGFAPLTQEIHFFNNLKEIPYIPFFEAGILNPLEIHLILIISSLFILVSVKKDFFFKPIPVWLPFLLFVGCLLFSFIYGLQKGGDLLVAMWEVRALFYFSLVYLIVPQVITTRSQLTKLIWIFIFGIAFKAFQGIGRFVELGFTTGGYDVLTNHEDPVFIVTLFIFLLGLLVFKADSKQRIWLIVLILPLALGFYVGQRRASYASLIVAIATFTVLLPALERRTFLTLFLPVLFGLLLYGFLFWNSNTTIAAPVQMVKSGLVKPDVTTNYRDYHSNLYRSYENYNLAKTAVNYPILGTGFGKKYDQPIPLINIRFPLRDYIPHNQIIWIMVKMGGIGFFAFWLFFNAYVARGAQLINTIKDPYLRAVIIFILVAIINQMVVSYYDLQLTYYRNMFYLGTLMGLLPVVVHIHNSERDIHEFSEAGASEEADSDPDENNEDIDEFGNR